MKIIQEPDISQQECKNCHCIVQLRKKDLKRYYNSVKENWICPICKYVNYVKFNRHTQGGNCE